VIGSLHLLADAETPFHAFTKLAHKFGPIYQLKLGSSLCVIVNNFALIKEVLITKGGHFGGRPDFSRFHHLFGGDRNNCKYFFYWFYLNLFLVLILFFKFIIYCILNNLYEFQ
jgi:cytochrome P450 family 307 subfamily A